MLAEGDTIGTYRVLSKLGEGGMGTVYLGEHTLLGRRAAIKVLLPQLSANQDIVQRFFNEARAVTLIVDPGIVQIFDFGYHTDGSAFLVMELLAGEAMDKRLERIGRMSLPEVLRLMRLICTSLSAAHAKGIVHRDLKPENIYIVGDPAVTGGERAKILDFGIAKLSGEDAGTLKTRTGMMMGTPVYMSPEQCRGAPDIDHRSDIYTMGCVMFTMLTGRPPFESDNSGDLIVSHIREPAPLAGARLAGLPPVVDQILQQCMSKAPADRFQSMTDLVQALTYAEQVAFGGPGGDLRPSAPYLAMATPPPGLRTAPTDAPITLAPAAHGRRWLGVALGGALVAGGLTAYLVTRSSRGPGSSPRIAVDASVPTHATAPADAKRAPPPADATAPADAAPPADAPVVDAALPPPDAPSLAPSHSPTRPHGTGHHAGSAAPTPFDRAD